MRIIKSTRGQDIIVDDEWYPLVSLFTWGVSSAGMVRRAGSHNGGHQPTIYLHRVITSCPLNLEVDHINHNPLDNRECNLRIVTKSQNGINRRQKAGRSGAVGVRWSPTNKKWEAGLTLMGKYIYLGQSDTVDGASKLRQDGEVKYFGEYRPKEEK